MKSYALLLLLAIQPLYAEELYRWVDADGNVQYTQTPPPAGVNAEVQRLKEVPSAAAEGLPQPKEEGKKGDAATEPTNDADKMMAEKTANCQKSMQDLQTLESKGKIVTVQDGKSVTMDETARKQRIDNEKAYIKTYCDGIDAPAPKVEPKKPEKK